MNDRMTCANADLKADMDRWHRNKRSDFRKIFVGLADRQIQYYETVCDSPVYTPIVVFWKKSYSIIPCAVIQAWFEHFNFFKVNVPDTRATQLKAPGVNQEGGQDKQYRRETHR